MRSKAKKIIRSLLQQAGIEINGNKPWDIHVHDERLYSRVLTGGTLAAGESYMEGWWDVRRLDLFFEKIFEAELEKNFSFSFQNILTFIYHKLFNPQSIKKSFQVGEKHYNRGNILFKNMLDDRLTYSCGYWKNVSQLDKAQEQKLDLICKKLELEPGMTLLDIGCGWGSLVNYASKNYGVHSFGITVSKKQVEYIKSTCHSLPVDITLKDYRKLDDKFDRIASVGMVEHVGKKNYSSFMEIANRCLKPDGIFLLHTIGSNTSRNRCDPWIEKYIFPNSMLPSLSQLTRAAEPYFIMEDLHSFGPYYDRTLMAWDKNFRNSWHKLANNYDHTFYRMWRYYLMSSAASFRTRTLQLWQMLFTKPSRRTMAKTVR